MKHYTHLSEEERENIYLLLQSWLKQKEIASNIWRDIWTISRELSRNSTVLFKSRNNSADKQKEDYQYLPDRANIKYLKRRKQDWWRPPLKNPKIFEYVVSGMKEKWWSPDIIAGTIKLDYPENISMRISHECIYQFIYSKKWEELGLKKYLLRSHKRRKKKNWRKVRRSNIPGRIDISLRPESVLTREEFGHYEWDSIVSWNTKWPALHTEIERKSRYIFAKKIERKTAELTLNAMISIFTLLPEKARITLTLDNGSENTKHRELTLELKMLVYYAKPYHSRERWSNENGNWMIRRFFPKGTDFRYVTQKQIQKVVDYLNNRPRKILNYKTPKEVFNSCLSNL